MSRVKRQARRRSRRSKPSKSSVKTRGKRAVMSFAQYVTGLTEAAHKIGRRPIQQLRQMRTEFRPVLEGDPVIECLNHMRGQGGQWGRSLLTNGKVEMQLKFLLGRSWEAGDVQGARDYVLDKNFYT